MTITLHAGPSSAYNTPKSRPQRGLSSSEQLTRHVPSRRICGSVRSCLSVTDNTQYPPAWRQAGFLQTGIHETKLFKQHLWNTWPSRTIASFFCRSTECMNLGPPVCVWASYPNHTSARTIWWQLCSVWRAFSIDIWCVHALNSIL